jgi:hypothetical protein
LELELKSKANVIEQIRQSTTRVSQASGVVNEIRDVEARLNTQRLAIDQMKESIRIHDTFGDGISANEVAVVNLSSHTVTGKFPLFQNNLPPSNVPRPHNSDPHFHAYVRRLARDVDARG